MVILFIYLFIDKNRRKTDTLSFKIRKVKRHLKIIRKEIQKKIYSYF